MSRRLMTSCMLMSWSMLLGASRPRTSKQRSRCGATPWQPCLNSATRCDIGWYYGDRSRLRALFEEADDSSEPLDTYIDEGRVIVARLGDQVVGHLQLIDAGRDGSVELSNLAVVPQKRGVGIGRRRVDQAIVVSLQDGYARMIAAPAAADIENLRFYQRCGFRLSSVKPDAFDVDGGYQPA